MIKRAGFSLKRVFALTAGGYFGFRFYGCTMSAKVPLARKLLVADRQYCGFPVIAQRGTQTNRVGFESVGYTERFYRSEVVVY